MEIGLSREIHGEISSKVQWNFEDRVQENKIYLVFSGQVNEEKSNKHVLYWNGNIVNGNFICYLHEHNCSLYDLTLQWHYIAHVRKSQTANISLSNK